MYQAFVTAWLHTHWQIGADRAFIPRDNTLEVVSDHFDKRKDCGQISGEHETNLQKDYVWRRVAEILQVERGNPG